MKRIKIIICTAFALLLFNNSKVLAAEEFINSEFIPEEMQPYTEIEYVSNHKYRVLKGGLNTNAYNGYNPSIPAPEDGMKVFYASDGRILNIINVDGNEPDYSDLTNLANLEIVPYTSLPDVPIWLKPFASWGNNNFLWRTNGQIIGFGRATTFSDTIGQQDNYLQKGDVATKMIYDNCAFGLTINVTANIKGTNTAKTVQMKKKDVGGLPDAVLDIWKTGVEYWGYTWNPSFSIPDTITYDHVDR